MHAATVRTTELREEAARGLLIGRRMRPVHRMAPHVGL